MQFGLSHDTCWLNSVGHHGVGADSYRISKKLEQMKTFATLKIYYINWVWGNDGFDYSNLT